MNKEKLNELGIIGLSFILIYFMVILLLIFFQVGEVQSDLDRINSKIEEFQSVTKKENVKQSKLNQFCNECKVCHDGRECDLQCVLEHCMKSANDFFNHHCAQSCPQCFHDGKCDMACVKQTDTCELKTQ